MPRSPSAVAYPDEILRGVADRMAALALGVPAVDRAEIHHPNGLVTHFDLLEARLKLLEEERHAERVLTLRRVCNETVKDRSGGMALSDGPLDEGQSTSRGLRDRLGLAEVARTFRRPDFGCGLPRPVQSFQPGLDLTSPACCGHRLDRYHPPPGRGSGCRPIPQPQRCPLSILRTDQGPSLASRAARWCCTRSFRYWCAEPGLTTMRMMMAKRAAAAKC